MPALFSPRRLAFFAAALLPLLPASAFAAVATISQGVNLRSGPGTNFGTVAKLQPGDTVDISKCQGTFCYVSTNAGNGWVSAAYLTRDTVQKPAPKIVASVPPATTTVTTSELPATTMSSPAMPTPKPSVVTPKPSAAAPRQAFPPAYDSSNAPPVLQQPPAPDNNDNFASDDSNPLPDANSQPFSDDNNADDVAASNVPRPKADIPEGALSGPDDEDFSSDDSSASSDRDFTPPANDNNTYANDVPDNNGGWDVPPGLRTDRFQRLRRFGLHRDFANLEGTTGPARACFVADDGGPGFCVHEGQHVADLSDWADRALFLRNPAGLEVTVCTDAAFHDCHTYNDSGPIRFGGGRSIASVTVVAPGY